MRHLQDESHVEDYVSSISRNHSDLSVLREKDYYGLRADESYRSIKQNLALVHKDNRRVLAGVKLDPTGKYETYRRNQYTDAKRNIKVEL